jgi:hypothetical protein
LELSQNICAFKMLAKEQIEYDWQDPDNDIATIEFFLQYFKNFSDRALYSNNLNSLLWLNPEVCAINDLCGFFAYTLKINQHKGCLRNGVDDKNHEFYQLIQGGFALDRIKDLGEIRRDQIRQMYADFNNWDAYDERVNCFVEAYGYHISEYLKILHELQHGAIPEIPREIVILN